jgi:hypothetical protein
MSDDLPHWSEDPYWTEALTAWRRRRDRGLRFITIDLNAVEQVIYQGGGPAYALMDALHTVRRDEGYYGLKGAPRVLLALLMRLAEASGTTGRINRLPSSHRRLDEDGNASDI